MAWNINDYWVEGRYVDLWTIPHILAGVVLAGFLNWFSLSFWSNIIISMLIIIGWEFFELYMLDIHEHIPNKIMDVLTGLIGFLGMHYFINIFSIGPIIPYLIILTIIYISFNIWGYLVHKTIST